VSANAEAGAQRWRKSSYSNGDGGNCVEVARPGAGLLVRDSKRGDGPVVAVGAEAWGAFVGEFRDR
jgi:uncharacterized protein DUF397